MQGLLARWKKKATCSADEAREAERQLRNAELQKHTEAEKQTNHTKDEMAERGREEAERGREEVSCQACCEWRTRFETDASKHSIELQEVAQEQQNIQAALKTQTEELENERIKGEYLSAQILELESKLAFQAKELAELVTKNSEEHSDGSYGSEHEQLLLHQRQLQAAHARASDKKDAKIGALRMQVQTLLTQKSRAEQETSATRQSLEDFKHQMMLLQQQQKRRQKLERPLSEEGIDEQVHYA